MEENKLLSQDVEYNKINQVYDECLDYLSKCKLSNNAHDDTQAKKSDVIQNCSVDGEKPGYETIKDIDIKDKDDTWDISNNKNNVNAINTTQESNEPESLETQKLKSIYKNNFKELAVKYKIENEVRASESLNSIELKSARLQKLSKQLPKIIITQSKTSLELKQGITKLEDVVWKTTPRKASKSYYARKQSIRKTGYGEFPKRLVSKSGLENVAVISNVPFEKIRLLNDTFHTLINLRWRWIVTGTVVVHFLLWLVFAVFWYITALAHYDFEPNPPNKTCVTGGKDFVTIFLASVESQTTIGFGDRAIDEECPESIFLFITQLILGTGLSGVLTCAVYAKLTRPEKMSRDGVGFSKKAVISMRDERLCLMMRAWDLNYDHIISSDFTAHFVNTRRTKEGEVIRYYARRLPLQQRQFLLWPVTLVHVIDQASPLYAFTPEHFIGESYEITLTLKGASASMGTYTQSQTSYLPRELVWGHRFPPVVKYDARKQKYVIDHKKLDATDPVDTPYCSASQLDSAREDKADTLQCPGTPSSFSEKITTFQLERSSSFRRKNAK